MKTSAQGLALIREFEGFSAIPYHCPAGRLTIGYGHLIEIGEHYTTLSQGQAELLLIQDVTWAEQAIGRLVAVAINQNQFDALVSFCYNIGIKAFEKSALLRLLNSAAPGVAAQFARWVYINGEISPGLARRRAAEAALFSQPVDS